MATVQEEKGQLENWVAERMKAHADAMPKTPLAEVAELLLEAQQLLKVGNTSERTGAETWECNDKLAQARILVDVLRGDGQ